MRQGGYVDFTVRSIRSRKALQQYHRDNIPLSHVTVSSDAFGSLPSFNEDGQLVKYMVRHNSWESKIFIAGWRTMCRRTRS